MGHGPGKSAEQCEGTVTAYDSGLFVAATSGTSEEIPWSQIETYGSFASRDSLVINAGSPWSWFFILRLTSAEECDQWLTLLEKKTEFVEKRLEVARSDAEVALGPS